MHLGSSSRSIEYQIRVLTLIVSIQILAPKIDQSCSWDIWRGWWEEHISLEINPIVCSKLKLCPFEAMVLQCWLLNADQPCTIQLTQLQSKLILETNEVWLLMVRALSEYQVLLMVSLQSKVVLLGSCPAQMDFRSNQIVLIFVPLRNPCVIRPLNTSWTFYWFILIVVNFNLSFYLEKSCSLTGFFYCKPLTSWKIAGQIKASSTLDSYLKSWFELDSKENWPLRASRGCDPWLGLSSWSVILKNKEIGMQWSVRPN